MSRAPEPDFDVLIAGAGLVGQALAPALANCGLSVALVDRAAVTVPESPAVRRRLGCARLRDQPGQRGAAARAWSVAVAAVRPGDADRDDARRGR